MSNHCTADADVPEAGETYNGKVVKTTSFGAFVNLTPGTDGLLHISQIRNLANGERIDAVEDVLKEGDTVEVVVQGVDDPFGVRIAPQQVARKEAGSAADLHRPADPPGADPPDHFVQLAADLLLNDGQRIVLPERGGKTFFE